MIIKIVKKYTECNRKWLVTKCSCDVVKCSRWCEKDNCIITLCSGTTATPWPWAESGLRMKTAITTTPGSSMMPTPSRTRGCSTLKLSTRRTMSMLSDVNWSPHLLNRYNIRNLINRYLEDDILTVFNDGQSGVRSLCKESWSLPAPVFCFYLYLVLSPGMWSCRDSTFMTQPTYLHLHSSRDVHYEVIIFRLLHLRNV